MSDISNHTADQIEKPIPEKRPRQITTLSWIYFLVSLFHILKFFLAVRNYTLLRSLPLVVSPLYLAANGIIWGILGLLITLGLWKGRNWSKPAAMILSILYGLVFWADRIWVAEPEGLAQRWPFNLFLTIIGIGLIFFILNRKSSKEYFRTNPAKIP